MKDNNIEKRSIGDINISDNYAQGYALVFNKESDGLQFIEVIDKRAISDEIINRSDIFAVLDHKRDRGILARSRFGKGSLELKIDDTGLFYRFKIADTPIGNELRSYLERGEIDSSSFAFTTLKDNWERRSDGKYIRHILEFDKLFDVSPVFTPAYSDTTVALRSLDSYKEVEQTNLATIEDELRAKQLQNAQDLQNYYDALKSKLNGL